MKHEDPVTGVVFSKDEILILTWILDGTALLWRVKNGSPIALFMKYGTKSSPFASALSTFANPILDDAEFRRGETRERQPSFKDQ